VRVCPCVYEPIWVWRKRREEELLDIDRHVQSKRKRRKEKTEKVSEVVRQNRSVE